MNKIILFQFNSIDSDRDGRIDYSEFKKLWTNTIASNDSSNQKYSDTQLKELFDRYDTDRTGYLERNEIKQLLINSGEYPDNNRITQLINSVDRNRDGKLNFDEFLQLYSKYRSDQPSRSQLDDNSARASQQVCFKIFFICIMIINILNYQDLYTCSNCSKFLTTE